MGDPFFQKIKTTNYALKLIITVLLGAMVLRYGMNKNATVSDVILAFAAIPVEIVILSEVLDKFSDKMDFRKIYAAYYNPEKKSSAITAALISLGIGALIFLSILYAITGTITLSLGALGAGAVIAAAIPALYILLPETGDDELILFAWLAAQVATGFSHFNSILLALALGKTSLSAVTWALAKITARG